MSSIETEHVMERLRQDRNVTDNRGRLLAKQTRFLTSKERTVRNDELHFINGVLNQPAWVNKGTTGETIKTLTKRRNHLEDDLRDNAPPEIESGTRDALYKYQKDLEEKIAEGMPTQEVMRRNPVGAVDMHTAWERGNKQRIKTWKNVCRLIEPDNDQKDYTNVERLRKSGLTPDMAASYMMTGQIPGNFAMTSLAKANWPLGEPKVDTPLKTAERIEVADDIIAKGYVPESQYDELKAELKKLQEQVSLKNINIDKVVNSKIKKAHVGKPWTCDWPECGQEMLTTQKGGHLAKHKRDATRITHSQAD